MTLKFNPFALTTHNGVQGWPRFLFHILPHIMFGACTLVGAWLLRLPTWTTFVIPLALGVFVKFAWFDWKRTSGTLFHFPVVHTTIDVPDVISDLSYSILLPLLYAGLAVSFGVRALAFLPAYYILSLFNGT